MVFYVRFDFLDACFNIGLFQLNIETSHYQIDSLEFNEYKK